MNKAAERKLAKKAKKEAQAQRLRDSLNTDPIEKNITVKYNPITDKIPRFKEPQYKAKTPSLNINPKTFQSIMTWCAEVSDITDLWSWNEPRAWEQHEWVKDIRATFNNLEGQKWSEISAMRTGGKKRRKLHHSQEISTLPKEVQTRWLTLGLEEFETLYRFRLGSTKRAWGFQSGSHFHLVWFERYHKIYPTHK